jgi:hypothetical protein
MTDEELAWIQANELMFKFINISFIEAIILVTCLIGLSKLREIFETKK